MFQQTFENPKTQLCELFYKYGSDKCPQIFHSYSESYYELLKDHKIDYKEILEIGIGTNEIMVPIVGNRYQIGSSLRAWRDFFPNATVYGLDIDTRVFFESENIICLYTDQSKSESLEKTINEIRTIKKNSNILFDLIVDDGSHLIHHMMTTFNCLFKYVRPGGIYIIEDIKKNELHIFQEMKLEDGEVIMSHPGNSDWDAFLAIRKNKD